MYNVLGVPYVNQYDVTASLLNDFLQTNQITVPIILNFQAKKFLIGIKP